MKRIHRKPRFLREASLIEYSLIALLIAAAIVGMLLLFEPQLSRTYDAVYHSLGGDR